MATEDIRDNTEELKSLSDKLDDLTKAIESGTRARFAQTAGQFAGTAAGSYMEQRAARSGMGGAVARGAAGAAMKGAGRMALGALGGPVGMTIAAVATIAAMASMFKGRRGGGVVREQTAQLEKQTALLAASLAESRKTRVSMERNAAMRTAARDPFARGARFHEQRMIAQGTMPQFRDFYRAGLRADAASQLEEARAFSGRQGSLFGARLGAGITRTRAGIERARGRFRQGAAGALDFWAGTVGQTMATGQPFGAMATQWGQLGGVSFAESQLQIENMRQRGRANRLEWLGIRGPGNVLQAPGTAQAGTMGDYQMKLRFQRRELQNERTEQWQQEILEILQQMTNEGVRGADDELRRRRMQFDGVW